MNKWYEYPAEKPHEKDLVIYRLDDINIFLEVKEEGVFPEGFKDWCYLEGFINGK